ncbi:MAG: hypothetical protein HOP15_01005 [Planctomycetes bacterium]|nr:hypothetical protein [Planctomycetota bacterium]
MNCRQNEEKVFPSLFEELDGGFVEARLHTDGDRGEELSQFQEQLARSIATPLYLVLDPDTERVLAGPLGGTVSVSGFREFLAKAKRAGEHVKVGSR